jgi:hypothetical protein
LFSHLGGKIETVVQLEPSGVGEVVTDGWDIRRNIERFYVLDGGERPYAGVRRSE